MKVNEVSGVVVDAAMKVHSALGPGLLESAYEACLAHELRNRGLRVEAQVLLPVVYDGVRIDAGYRMNNRRGGQECLAAGWTRGWEGALRGRSRLLRRPYGRAKRRRKAGSQ